MKHCIKVSVLFLLSAVVLLAAVPKVVHADDSPERAAPQNPRIGALLVGVAEYPALHNVPQLHGPPNDVAFAYDVLTHSLHVSTDTVVRMTDRAGNQPEFSRENASTQIFRPTKANIRAGFDYMASLARTGKIDQCVILLSGHGTQVGLPPGANLLDQDNPEPDGYDEYFLAGDTSKWDERKHVVAGAIGDNEIKVWLRSIRDAGAFVFVIFDSCHSGTMTRGGSVTVRNVPASLLGVPASRRRTPASQGPIGNDKDDSLDVQSERGMFALFASRSNEPSNELHLPLGSSETTYGLLTYSAFSVLARNGRSISYRQLVDRTLPRIRRARAEFPEIVQKPFGVGESDKQVLGVNNWPERVSIHLRKDNANQYWIEAGTAHGVTVGSIYAVYNPEPIDGDTNTRKQEPREAYAYVKVARTQPVRSRVEIVSYKTVRKALQLNNRSTVEEVQHALGPNRLHMALLPENDAAAPLVEAVQAKLAADDGTERCVVFVDDVTSAELVARISAYRNVALYFKPRGENLETSLTQTVARFEASTAEGLAAELGRRIRPVYKWKLLRSMAGGVNDAPTARGGDTNEQLVVAPFRMASEGGTAEVPLEPDDVLHVGEKIGVRIQNRTANPLDVTLLFLRENFGVMRLWPTRAGQNRIDPGTSNKWGPVLISGSNVRPENILAIAVPSSATGGTIDFGVLAQSPMYGSRGSDKGVEQWIPPTALGELMRDAIYGTRGGNGAFSSLPMESLQSTIIRAFPIHAVGGIPTHFSTTPEVYVTSGTLDAVFVAPRVRHSPMKAAPRSATRGGLDIYGRIAPSVVLIRSRVGHGTGFFIDDQGTILTNHHVIAAGMELNNDRQVSTVQVFTGTLQDGEMQRSQNLRGLTAEILDFDTRRDLALLRMVDPLPEPIQPVRLAKQPARPGETCYLMGHPSSGMMWTLRSGMISSKGDWPQQRTNDLVARLELTGERADMVSNLISKMPRRKIVLTTCLVNPGDSGGPIVNEKGELVAVTFARPADLEDATFGYGVDLSEVREFVDSSQRAGRIVLPDPWHFGPRFALIHRQILVAGIDQPEAILFDLDQDTPIEALQSGDPSVLIGERAFDAEVILNMTQGGRTAFYDRDNDGTFDLIVIDDDADGQVDPRAELWFSLEDGHWTMRKAGEDSVDGMIFIDPSKMEDEQLGKTLAALLDKME